MLSGNQTDKARDSCLVFTGLITLSSYHQVLAAYNIRQLCTWQADSSMGKASIRDCFICFHCSFDLPIMPVSIIATSMVAWHRAIGWPIALSEDCLHRVPGQLQHHGIAACRAGPGDTVPFCASEGLDSQALPLLCRQPRSPHCLEVCQTARTLLLIIHRLVS
jgi:hypothetical protein